LVTDAFGGSGGIAQYNRDFLCALAWVGNPVVALPRSADQGVDLPHNIRQLRARPNKIWYCLTAFVVSLRSRPSVIFCGHLSLAPFAWVLAKLNGAKLIIQVHGIEAWVRPSRLIRLAIERADSILSASRYTRARVMAWAAVPPERVIVVNNTVSSLFTVGDGMALRDELCLQGKTILLTVGRMDSLEKYKGHDRVITALPKLLEAGHDIVYVIVGDGDDRPRIAGLAERTGVGPRVAFTGPLSRTKLIDAYRMADLFVMPSTGEGFGIVFLEAMACGTPAVGLAIAGACDALADGQLGKSVQEWDLAGELLHMLSSPSSDRVALSRNTHDRFGEAAFRARIRMAVTAAT
jgi:phosphatidylinositol alpha-1,6-mannosyltransferase